MAKNVMLIPGFSFSFLAKKALSKRNFTGVIVSFWRGTKSSLFRLRYFFSFLKKTKKTLCISPVFHGFSP